MSLSNHQVFMLKHFAMGWKFKLKNNINGSWTTYWSLRRHQATITGVQVWEVDCEVTTWNSWRRWCR